MSWAQRRYSRAWYVLTMQGNRPNLPDADSAVGDADVVCAYDDVDDTPAFLVADITRDDAWLSIAAAGALELDAWR